MFRRLKTKVSKFTAGFLALLMVLSVVLEGNFLTTLAATVDSYTISLTDGTDVIAIDNVEITITEKENTNNTKTESTVKGVATFNDFVEEDKTYVVSVGATTGYEDVADCEITPIAGGEKNHNISMTAINKITISGVVKNENDELYSGATVEISGYVTTSTTTNASGEYSFEAYVGKDYTIKAIANEEKYVEQGTTVISPSADYRCTDLKFTVKNFTIETSAEANGIITATESVEYGTNKTITATADEGYRISNFKVDGVEQEKAKGEKTFDYTFEDVKAGHKVTVAFARQTYKITFTVGENGKVSYVDGTAQEVAGGSVDVEKIFDESTDSANPTKVEVTATPNENYRVSKVTIDAGESEEFTENNKSYTKELEMTKDHTFEVEFSLNEYVVEITHGENGTATVADKNTSVVKWGENVIITIKPSTDTYKLRDILISSLSNPSGTLVDLDNDTNLERTEDGSYTYIVQNIQEDTYVDVTFEEVTTLAGVWTDYVSIAPLEGTLNKSYVDEDGNEVYIYSNDAKLVMQAVTKDDVSYTYTNYHVEGKNKYEGWKSNSNNRMITSSCVIDALQVQENSRGKGFYEVPLESKIIIIIDTEVPTVKSDKAQLDWTNANEVVVSGSVSDENTASNPSSGLSHIVWSKDATLSKEQVLAETVNKVAIAEDGSYSFTVTEEQNSTYYIYAVDVAGNVSSAATTLVQIDRTAPKIEEFQFSEEEGNIVQKFIRFLSFGTICQKTIFVTVVAADADISSGLNEITLYYGESTLGPISVQGNYAVFALTEDMCKYGVEIAAVVTDNAANTSVKTKPTDLDGDAQSDIVKINSVKPSKPEITIVTVEDDKKGEGSNQQLWFKGNVEFAVKVEDVSTGIWSVDIKLNGEPLDKEADGTDIPSDFSSNYVTEKTFKINTSQGALDGENTLEVIVKNNAGIVSEKTTSKVYIDTTNPDITNFEVKDKNGTVLDKILNFLTFGVFFNEQVQVTVTANDDIVENNNKKAASGVETITLYLDGVPFGEPEKVVDNQATFTLPAEEVLEENEKLYLDKTISAKATDYVGNTTEEAVEMKDRNSNIKDSGLMIETIKPTIEITPDAPASNKNNETADKNDWYKSDIEFDVKVGDENSGLRSVLIKINGTVLVDDKFYDETQEQSSTDKEEKSKDYTVRTDGKDVERKDNGSYTLEVVVTDNAGNAKTEIKTVYKDTDKPYITGFDFEPEDYVEGKEDDLAFEETDYGFYFKEDTKVTISAKDDAPSAGVKEITYYTVDKDTGKGTEISEPVDKDGKIEIELKAPFKGQIYAMATDNVDNKQDKFVTPNSSIVEDTDKHDDETHIVFEKEKTDYKANNGTELYSKDVPVTITVTDTYSGIRSIEWAVVADYDTEKNQSGKVTINNDKTFVTEDSKNCDDKDWEIVAEEGNLATVMQRTITIDNNSNDIIVKVRMTDRAGNSVVENVTDAEGWQYINFSIDKTNPVIKVEYDNNASDETYTDIFKANRTATITITERNFKASDVVYKITNTDGAIPTLSSWEEHKNEEKPDKTYYTATINYVADGDYTFDISYADLAKNEASDFTQHTFTIDKTIPTVSVAYDNNSALNGNYYKADRVATLTIVEHNFDASRVNVDGVATDNGVATSFPVTSAWTSNGDTHVATIHYSNDARYVFDIEFLDKAGNSIADYVTEEFYVDKTAPTIEISGVADKSANNGTVAPVVTYSDTNFNKDTVSIELSGINNGKVNYNGESEPIINGQKFTYEDFERIESVDDIYTITATLTDMAGNQTTKTISFSANRFGSVYNLSNVSDINGRFLKTEEDIVFIETNVDTLNRESIKIKLTKNGVPTDLVEGVDYTVEVSGGNGQWSNYKYTIKKNLFSDDGRYSIAVYSVDAAGNINENIEESKKAEISFGIDKTNPVVVPIDFESGKQYPVEMKKVSIEIKDNLVLEGVKIYLNGKEIEYEVEGETYTFSIPESNEKQTVKVVAIDAAGNEHELLVESFLVSTNIFVRWYNNTPLFIGSIIGVAVLALGITWFIVFGKKKKEEDEEK